MSIHRWTLALVAVFAFGQEEAPFPQETTSPWKPSWELTLRGDRLSNPVETLDDFSRSALQLRLRWSWELAGLKLVAGTRSALGSDGNQFNAGRWDQQPSNGSQLDLAHADASWVAPRTFGGLSLGFQENRLLVSQAIWDRDMRFLGLGGAVGVRSTGGLVQEAGFRAAAGRVRNILGGQTDLAAGQAVLKLDTGAWSWTAHAGRWELSWDPGDERLRRLPAHDPLARQKMSLDALGASTRWNTLFPVETRWFWSRNRESRETSEELQAAIGSRERVYWPQISFTWQRLSSTGTLYPVNGDEWWFYRRAQGHRFDLSLPLPGQWLASGIILRQRSDGDPYQVTRKQLVLTKRF
jgi:hypothetical protein